MKNISISPKLVIAILVITVVIVGAVFYKGMSGPSAEETEQKIEQMHERMMRLPGQQPSQPQPVTVPQPTKP